MWVARNIRDLFHDEEGNPAIDTNPTLWDVAFREVEPIVPPRTEVEDRCRAGQPGDDPTKLPFYRPPNPYLMNPFTMGLLEKVRGLREGTLKVSPEEREQILEAAAALR